MKLRPALKGILKLFTGTVLAQAVSVLALPFISRIFTPNDFAIFALFLSSITLLSTFASGRYELAIILPRREEHSKLLVNFVFVISFFINLLFLIILLIHVPEFLEVLGLWVYAIPLVSLLVNINQAVLYWLNRHGKYKEMSIAMLINTSATTISNLSNSLYSFTGLIGSHALGLVCAISMVLFKHDEIRLSRFDSKKSFIMAKKYRKFLFANMPHAFINNLKTNVVIIILPIMFNQLTAGLYFFAYKIIMLPSTLVGKSVGQVFFREASREYKKTKNIRKMTMIYCASLLAISATMALPIFFILPKIFVFLFGAEWEEAGSFAAYMLPYTVFHFAASPITMVPLVTNQQDKALYWGVSESILFVAVFYFGHLLFNNIEQTLQLLSFIFCIYFPIYFSWVFYIAKDRHYEV